MEEAPRPQLPEPESDDEGKNKPLSRRDFLRKGAAGAAALYGLGKASAEEIPTGERGVKYAELYTKDRSFEGKPEDAPGLGKFEQEAQIFTYFLLPRNEEEVSKLKKFLEFVHGEAYRQQISAQLTMYKPDPQLFDEAGWKFYDKYFRGERMAKIAPKATNLKKLENDFKMTAGLLGEDRARQELGESIKESSSRFDLKTKEAVLNMSEPGLNEWDFKFSAVPPSLIAMHEVGHVTQHSDDVYETPIAESRVSETISIFDGVAAVLIDKELRRQRGLAADSDGDQKLYEKEIVFPSGVKYTVGRLAKLAEQFYDLRDQKDFERTAVQLFSSPEGIQFFDRLVYGDPGRSSKLDYRWRKAVAQQERAADNFQKEYEKHLEGYMEKFRTSEVGKELGKSAFDNEEAMMAALREELKDNPESVHRLFVEELEIQIDPIYELVTVPSPDELIKETKVVRERTRASILRDAVNQDKEARAIWKQYNFVVDLADK